MGTVRFSHKTLARNEKTGILGQVGDLYGDWATFGRLPIPPTKAQCGQ